MTLWRSNSNHHILVVAALAAVLCNLFLCSDAQSLRAAVSSEATSNNNNNEAQRRHEDNVATTTTWYHDNVVDNQSLQQYHEEQQPSSGGGSSSSGALRKLGLFGNHQKVAQEAAGDNMVAVEKVIKKPGGVMKGPAAAAKKGAADNKNNNKQAPAAAAKKGAGNKNNNKKGPAAKKGAVDPATITLPKKKKKDMTEEELNEVELQELKKEHEEDIAGGEEIIVNADGDEIVEPKKHGPPPKKEAPAMIRGEKRNLENLLMSFQMAKAKMLEQIKQDYGPDNFDALFMDTPAAPMPLNKTECTIGRNAFVLGVPAPKGQVAWERTVRKMKLNILQYLIEGNVQDFVWATAGNSDAAGHGNFFGEQYTMVMKDRAADMFESVGLNLVARPYAMGRATSAPEIAACAEEIFGTDVDMLTWDFAMTDGRWHWRLEFFAHRVNRLPNHPPLLVLQAGTEPVRRMITRDMVQHGLTVMRQDEKYVMDRKLAFPDCRYRTADELDLMPDLVHGFRCGYGLEMGPGCAEHKFTQNGTCDARPSRTNWHHGRKWHAFHGTLYALFLMEVMEDALVEMRLEESDPRALFQNLTAQEYENYRFFEAQAPKWEAKWKLEQGAAAQLYRDPAYCHTALLPAQTRYLGHVVDEERYDDWNLYYKGTALVTARTKPSHNILLAYEPKPRAEKCFEAKLPIDSQDYFIATYSAQAFQKITIPNEAEINAYGLHPTTGLIMVCAASCQWGCSTSPLLNPDSATIKHNKAEFRVNGETVASTVPLDNCYLLQRENGDLYWPGERYKLEVKVNSKGKQIRFTSIVVW